MASAALAGALCWAASAHADTALAEDVSRATRAALAIETEYGHPDLRGLQLYLATDAQKLLLRRVRIQVDNQAPYEYEFSEAQSNALRTGAIDALPSVALADGPHRIRAQFIARLLDARPTTPRVTASVDTSFTKTESAIFATLQLGAGGMLDDAALTAQFSAAEDDALRARVARFTREAIDNVAVADGAEDAPLRSIDVEIQRYNHAIAALQSGAGAEGEAELDALGRGEASGEGGLTLRDLANVTLGYARLRSHRGAEAIDVFRRVRSPGPYGNPALLGLGWAYLLPTASPDARVGESRADVWPASAAASPALRRQMPFRYEEAVAAGARADDLHHALNAWSELAGRDPLDPSVQEGMLAVPYAMIHLGAQQQAADYYARALEKLRGANRQLDAALAQLQGGQLLDAIDAQTGDGWRRWLADLPYDDAMSYVRGLCADPTFLDAYEAHRNLLVLDQKLSVHIDRLQDLAANADGVAAILARLRELRVRVGGERKREDERLTTVIAELLNDHRNTTNDYLAEAAFAIARLNDPTLPQMARASAGDSP